MKGFTLIELLATVMIIGVLAAVALPQYTRAVEKARATEAVIISKALQDAIQRHMQEFPSDTVERQGQIADVKLTGGEWVGAESLSESQCFVTQRFAYYLGANNIVVTRADEPTACGSGLTDYLYQVSFYKSMPDNQRSRMITCTTKNHKYDYLCSLFE